ncbi:hypothetical protein RIF29_29885 [Crotalaria pallida]|uniref:Uncharacterized protein n=1 Tax=Crotalaria pallida TaxID=3830 RepID=A0AAN9EFU1_CROPI
MPLKPTVLAKANPLPEESRCEKQERDKAILHQMRVLQQQGITGIDHRTTQILIPSKEDIEFMHSNKGPIRKGNSKAKPPDSAMDIDTQRVTPHSVEEDASHPSNFGPKDHSSIPSQ